METETLALAQEIDFSMWALFARATITVKLVVLMLIVSSFWSWSIIIQKSMNFTASRREAAKFEGIHDTPDGAEQTDKRSRRADGGKDRQALLQALGLFCDRDIHRPVDPCMCTGNQLTVRFVRALPLDHASGKDFLRPPFGLGADFFEQVL